MHSSDSPPHNGGDGAIDGSAIADSATLARYWNDNLPDAVNVATIDWWLSQASAAENSPSKEIASR